MRLNFCVFDWSGKNEDKSGKSQGILITCVSGKPDKAVWFILTLLQTS